MNITNQVKSLYLRRTKVKFELFTPFDNYIGLTIYRNKIHCISLNSNSNLRHWITK